MTSGSLAPPMTPEFKSEDEQATVESKDAKWKIHARTAHPALISGMKSLSETHEQFVVAWTGDILLQPSSQSTPQLDSQAKFQNLPSIAQRLEDNDTSPTTPNGKNRAAQVKDEKPLMVFGGEFTDEEKKELTGELKRFGQVETSRGEGGLTYVPVFLPPDISKGHYEGFCKKSESYSRSRADVALWPLFHYLLWLDSTATVPAPDPSWIAYSKTNQMFAQKVAEIYRPGDLIIVHDYHLLLAPKMIREALGQVSAPGGGWSASVTPSPGRGS